MEIYNSKIGRQMASAHSKTIKQTWPPCRINKILKIKEEINQEDANHIVMEILIPNHILDAVETQGTTHLDEAIDEEIQEEGAAIEVTASVAVVVAETVAEVGPEMPEIPVMVHRTKSVSYNAKTV